MKVVVDVMSLEKLGIPIQVGGQLVDDDGVAAEVDGVMVEAGQDD